MNKIIDTIRKSFSLKLSLYSFLSIGFLFCIIITLFFQFSYKTIENESINNAKQKVEISNIKLTNMFSSVSNIGDNYALSLDEFTEERITNITRQIVKKNPKISHSYIALEPNILKKDELYAVLTIGTDSSKEVKTSHIGSIKNYDYRYMEWYLIPKLTHKTYWTEPYYGKYSGKITSTYSIPLYDTANVFKGVLCIDLNIDQLSNILKEQLPYKEAKFFVIGRNGTYIYNENKEYIRNENIFSLAKSNNDNILYNVGQKMIDGETGNLNYKIDEEEYILSYGPLGDFGWSVAIALPKKIIFSSLKSTINIFLFISIMGLLLLLFFTYIIAKRMTSPLKSFALSAKEIAKGKFDTKLPQIKSKDEMLELYNSFDYMQNALSSYVTKLKDTTSAKEKIESELRIAKEIQMGMVPKLFPSSPNWKGIDLYASLTPAKEVGGDLYDFFIHDDKLYYVIGDVSGKGVPASLLMAVAHSLIRSNAAHFSCTSDIVNNLNKALSENNDANMFITLFLGILDLKSGLMKFCNAGHNPPILSYEDKTEFLTIRPNLPVGIMEDFIYTEEEITIKPGSLFFLYTDGLTEAENTAKELYGEDKMYEIIVANKNNLPKDIVNNAIKSVHSHVNGAPQSDDLTLMAFKYEQPFEISFTMDAKKLELTDNIEQLDKLKIFIESIGDEMQLPKILVTQLNVALEEAISNILLYAFKNKKDNEDKNITICAEVIDDQLIFTLKDSGSPFDPTLSHDPDITLSAEEREIGGLGIFIIKQIMNEVTYSRVENKNVFVLKKKLIKE